MYIIYDNGKIEKDGFLISDNMLSTDQIDFATWIAAGNIPDRRPAADYLTPSNTNLQQFKTEYQSTIDQLQQIENTTSPTNAQVIAAVKFLAKTIRLMLKLLARLLT